jgi:phosphate transport system substrate-binding protein
MSHNRIVAGFCGALLAVLACCGCGRKAESLTLAGSTAFQSFAEKLAEQYMAANPGVNITVQGGGSAVGVQAALSGAAQIGMADLVQLPPEADALTATVVARDGIAVVVHPVSLVTNLTLDQVRGIFNGTIKSWKEVGGGDAPITVVSREAGSGTRSSFEQIIKNINLTQDAIVQDSNGTIRETVANDPKAVGYLSHGLLNEKIKAVNVDDARCTNDEIQQGSYKLVRPMYLLTRGAPAGAQKAFIDYVMSEAGQKTIQDSGLIRAR